MKNNIYRDGKVHVCKRMCDTCIFRPDSVISRERVDEMVTGATADNSTIVCHHTINEDDQMACRGFFEKHPTPTLKIAQALDMIEYVEPKKWKSA